MAGWEDKDNHFVQLVHTMAQHCQQMADFSRGGTSLKVGVGLCVRVWGGGGGPRHIHCSGGVHHSSTHSLCGLEDKVNLSTWPTSPEKKIKPEVAWCVVHVFKQEPKPCTKYKKENMRP